MKKIAILTSGGDAPGMNPCLRACVRYAIYSGFEVYGVHRGYQGLLDDNIELLNSRSVSDIIQRGGTFLKSARCPQFKELDVIKVAADNLKKHDITDLIVIGGDGTFRGAKDLCDNFGINVIGIPGTIDNDLAYTDYTLGFATAVNTVLWAINSLRDTIGSHDRCSILEVMGRRCGDIALYAGLCGGAEHILVPEVPYDIEKIAQELKQSASKGKKSNLIVFAEGAGDREQIKKVLEEKGGLKVTVTTLGHIQRGGSPTMFDRVLASKMAEKAVDLLISGATNRVVGSVDNKIIDMDISKALAMPRVFDEKLYRLANILGL